MTFIRLASSKKLAAGRASPYIRPMLTRWKSLPTFAQVAIIAILALAVRALIIASGAVQKAPVATTPAPVATSVAAAGVNMDRYNILKAGMSYAEAVAILGSEGTEISSNDIGGAHTVMYQWKAGAFANMNAMFQNDRLISKAQSGLH